MTDRVPGAPGQYILTVSAAEAQKILTGEPVAVTLKRDDQPLVEGTPYNKASVLPDELASIMCPGVVDPAPADAFLGVFKKAVPYNYADNSDFTQFVAQAGIGGNHGTQAYAGDRWILDSGSVTGDANENGNGYSNIKLNGTIRQIVANAPEVGTAAINMVSGTAEISYANGEITITSNGGVIKNVRLFKGIYTADNMHEYQPKGYGAELLECQRYHYLIAYSIGGFSGYSYGSTIARCCIQLPVPMRVNPSLIVGNVAAVGVYPGAKSATGVELNMSEDGKNVTLSFTTSGLTAADTCFIRFNGARIALNADFPEEEE